MTEQNTALAASTGSAGLLPRSRAARTNAFTAAAAVLLTVVLSLAIPQFLDLRNVLNISEQLGVLGFMAIGMTFVMVSGGIDLSTYTVVSAASVVGATAMVAGYPPLVGCLLMLLIGVGFGAINGFAIAFGRMIPFIVTLSTMVLAQGFAIWFTQAQSISGLPEEYIEVISGKTFGVIPTPAIIVIVVAIISGVILARSQYGRWLYLTGSNERTARVSGIPVRLTVFSAYVFSGLMAGITAIVLTAMVGTATTAMVRDERLMDVIATTVIGGASLRGGSGSILGTMLGLLFITVLGNAFNLLGVSPFIAMMIKGCVLVAVIGLDVFRSR
jgi:ribose/xylose/arabinose/galactoside ABC-type transport system permease subunit